MTETRLRLKVVSGITKYNGATQGSTGHKEIIDIFNNSGLCKRHKMTYTDFWCAATASAAYIIAGLAGTGKGKIFPCVECACSAIINLAKNAGIWVENDSYVPKPGDLIIYDWQDSGIGDNKGDPDHVGIVVEVYNGVIKVFEGNMGYGYCGYRDLRVNGQYIRGFVCPDFKSIATASDTVTMLNKFSLYTYAYKDVLAKSSPVICVVPKGAKVIWLEDDGWGWSKIKYNSKTGWVMNNYLDMTGLSKFKVYTLPADTSAIVIDVPTQKNAGTTKLKKGTKYTLYSEIERGKYKGKRYIGIKSKRYYI